MPRQRRHQDQETGGPQRPVRRQHGAESARLRLRLLPLFGHDCNPTNAIGPREAPMPKAVRPGPTPPQAKRARGRRRPRRSPERVAEIFRRFAAANPEPKGELEYVNPYTLLVAVVLSAQATDAGVNKATRGLFKVADTPAEDAGAGRGRACRSASRPSASTATRPRTSSRCREALIAEHGGEVPHRARGAGSPARRRPQDRQRRAQHRLRRADAGRRHARVPRRASARTSPPARRRWRWRWAC